MHHKNYWVYILLCENQSYYTGYTDNLEKRYRAHMDGTSKCKYTLSFKPISLAQSWLITGDKALAMRLERAIKKLSRKQKIQLMSEPATLSTDPQVQPFKWDSPESSNLQPGFQPDLLIQ